MKTLHVIAKIVFIFFAVLLAGCQTNVKSKYDHTVDFSKYKTFCWMERL